MKQAAALFSFLIMIIGYSSCKHDPLEPIGDNGLGNPSNPLDTIDLPPIIESNCDPDSVYYENTIAPLLSASCGSENIGCHNGPSDENDEIDLSSWWALMNSDGGSLVTPGDALGSDLIDEILDGDMPPDTSSYSISNENLALLMNWIDQGAVNNSCDPGCDTSNVSFQTDIYPIIALSCSGCHSIADPDGGISLTNYENISEVALSGSLVPVIKWEVPDFEMPKNASQLPECYINLIEKWVNDGALNN